MMRVSRFLKALPALLLAGQATAGTISGRVVGKDGRPVRDAAVFVDQNTGSRKAAPLKRVAKMDTASYNFRPHVLAVQAGTTVEFTNGDWELHNFYSTSDTQQFDLHTIPRHATERVVFDRPGVVHVQCHFHEEMSAYIVVTPTPFFAITDARGRYTLKNVPAGKQRIKLWHEQYQDIVRPITVGSGPQTVDIKGLAVRPNEPLENPAYKPLY